MKYKMIVSPYDSPVGRLWLGSVAGCLCMCDWGTLSPRPQVWSRLTRCLGRDYVSGTDDVLEQTVVELDEYFAGQRLRFDIPLKLFGTEFQQKVWNGLAELPYGSTISYQELADSLGRHSSVRAVAGAVGANAMSIILPCHRVISSDGSLGGYAGGLDAKAALLALEHRVTESSPVRF